MAAFYRKLCQLIKIILMSSKKPLFSLKRAFFLLYQSYLVYTLFVNIPYISGYPRFIPHI